VGYATSQPVSLTTGYTVRVDEERDAMIEVVAGGRITSEFAITSLAMVSPKLRTPALRSALRKLFDALPPEVLDQVNQFMQPVALQLNTHSRGCVEAVSKDARVPPRVGANYFKDPRDWLSQQQRLQYILELGRTKAMANYTYSKIAVPLLARYAARYLPRAAQKALSCLYRLPQNQISTQLSFPCIPPPHSPPYEMARYLRDYVVSSYHYFGTAAAGTVVDGTDFHVKGLKGLYVVDASIIPAPTNVNPQGTIMALGHYIGSLLAKARRRKGNKQHKPR